MGGALKKAIYLQWRSDPLSGAPLCPSRETAELARRTADQLACDLSPAKIAPQDHKTTRVGAGDRAIVTD